MNETWLIEKCWRAVHFFRFIYGFKQRPCKACAGSGRYDNNGSPPCGGCEGTGRETYRGPNWSVDAFEKQNPKLYAKAVQLGIVQPTAKGE